MCLVPGVNLNQGVILEIYGISPLLLVLEFWDGKPNHRKSWAGNLQMWSDLTLSPSFKVKRGQPNLTVLIFSLLFVIEVCNVTRLLLILEVWDVKPTYRKSWAGNVQMWSDMTMDPSFKVK